MAAYPSNDARQIRRSASQRLSGIHAGDRGSRGFPRAPMNRERLLVVAAHALVWSIALVYLSGYIPTYDLWGYLSEGKLVWDTGGVPRVDVASNGII